MVLAKPGAVGKNVAVGPQIRVDGGAGWALREVDAREPHRTGVALAGRRPEQASGVGKITRGLEPGDQRACLDQGASVEAVDLTGGLRDVKGAADGDDRP